MKLKDTFKLFKYIQNPELNLVVMIMFGISALITAIPTPGNAFGAYWANYMFMYFIGQLSVVTISGVVQSSEKFKKLVTKNFAKLLAIGNLINYVIFVVLRTLIAYKIHTEKYVNGFLIIYMFFQILYVIYAAVINKYMKLGISIMILMLIFVIYSTFDHGLMEYVEKLGPVADIKVLVVLATVVSVLTPFLFYGLSLLLYKKPYNDKMLKRMERNTI